MAGLIDWVNKRFPLSEFIERHITRYPTPRNLNYFWNFGSLAGAFFVVQTITGIWLAMFYKPDSKLAFDSIQHIMRDINYGWLIRYMHAIGVTGIFFAIYVHISRTLYYGSYKKPRELLWLIGFLMLIGFLILISFMAEAFMGYLLPWGQMSYWGATAITNLFTAIPVVGLTITDWIRGDFAVGDPTLTRFFAIHTTLMPIGIIGLLIVFHLTALHRVGSNNLEGIDLDRKGPDEIAFSPYYISKDLWFIALFFTIFFYFVFFQPDFFLEPANNEPANPLKTPVDIVAEWYLLPFYSILKAIPDKRGGIAALALALLMIALLPLLDRSKVRSARHRPVKRILTWIFYADVILLAYVGSYAPYKVSFTGLTMHELGLIFTVYYFLYFLTMPVISYFEPIDERYSEKEDL